MANVILAKFIQEKKETMNYLNDNIFEEKGITNIIGDLIGNTPTISDEKFKELLDSVRYLTPKQAEEITDVLQKSQLVIIEEYVGQSEVKDYIEHTEFEDEEGEIMEVRTAFTDNEMKTIINEIADGDIRAEFGNEENFLHSALQLLHTNIVSDEKNPLNELIVVKKPVEYNEEEVEKIFGRKLTEFEHYYLQEHIDVFSEDMKYYAYLLKNREELDEVIKEENIENDRVDKEWDEKMKKDEETEAEENKPEPL